MPPLLRGALVEYGSDFLGPLPNVVIFQFNPETMSRVIQIPPRPTGASAREVNQAGDTPVERITIKAEFSATDQLNTGNVIAQAYGVGPQLAALEQMVHPSNMLGQLLGQGVDAIGSALGLGGGNGGCETQPIPREKYPRILFIWGTTRVLPVVLESMTITEQQYDAGLNPIQADVSIGMAVTEICQCSDDSVAQGAFAYSQTAKEAQAAINLAETAAQVAAELIPIPL